MRGDMGDAVAPSKHVARPRAMIASGDQVGRELAFKLGDLIAQNKLTLLDADDLQLVGTSLRLQGENGRVEVLVFLAQAFKLQADGPSSFVWAVFVLL
jgi:hypothetical protein